MNLKNRRSQLFDAKVMLFDEISAKIYFIVTELFYSMVYSS